MAAVRDRDARVNRTRDGGRHAGHDLVADARRSEFCGFFCTTAEWRGIAAFEPRHDLAFLRLRHDQRIDLILRQRVILGLLASVNALATSAPRHAQELSIARIVVDDHVRDLDAFLGAQVEQARITRASADEVNDAGEEGADLEGGKAVVRGLVT